MSGRDGVRHTEIFSLAKAVLESDAVLEASLVPGHGILEIPQAHVQVRVIEF